jgi:hypothetical protein
MVLIMSALLVLALLAVIWGFVRQARILMAAREAPAAAISRPGPGDSPLVTLTLAPGARIVSAQTGGGKLVLHVSGPRGDEVQVIDLATGALTGDVRAPAK